MNGKLIGKRFWPMYFGLGIVLILIVSVSYAQDDGYDASIFLPQQTNTEKIGVFEKQKCLMETNSWKDFIRKNGNWKVQWNEATRSPHRAYGPAIKMDGYDQINRENIEQAAVSFLKKNKSLLRVDVSSIKLLKATRVNRKWYVSFIQMHRGIEVLLSEIELRISDNGKVISFGVDYYNDIDLFSIPSLSFETVKLNAIQNLPFNHDTDTIKGDGKLYYLPIIKNDKTEYALVYKVIIKTKDPIGQYICYVDANSGAVRWRYNRVNKFFGSSGVIKGLIQQNSPSCPFLEKAFKSLTVKAGNEEVSSDKDGKISLNNTGQITLTAELKGPFVKVVRGDAENVKIRKPITQNEKFSLLWNDNNSCAAERDAFYHINVAHDYVKTINPDFTGMDYSIPVSVNVDRGECGAFHTDDGLIFLLPGTVNSEVTCENFAQKAEVICHEYGHEVTEKIYSEVAYAIE